VNGYAADLDDDTGFDLVMDVASGSIEVPQVGSRLEVIGR
jgi:hypothetical protein